MKKYIIYLMTTKNKVILSNELDELLMDELNEFEVPMELQEFSSIHQV
jgi:hypothetical protein